jgi:HlyD family secretion protein
LSVPITAVTAYDLREEEKKKREKLGNNSNEIGSTDQPVHESEFMEAVFLQKGDTCARIDVTTGIQDENFIEIKSGLKPEDIVVIGPYSAIAKSLKSGDRIKEKKEESKKKTGSE